MSVLEDLCTTVEDFCVFIEALPERALVESSWGPREVLAHLVYHHESYVEQVSALVSGEPYEPPKGRFSDLNAHAIENSRGVPIAELLRRFRRANEALCGFYRRPDVRAIVREIKKGAKPRSLAVLITEVEAHIRNHHRKLANKVFRGRW
jgi:hypothetical protein